MVMDKWLNQIKKIGQAPSRRELEIFNEKKRPFSRGTLLVLREAISRAIAKDLGERSAGITYHLILSLVPILGIGFTFFKAFGGLENFIQESIIPKIASYFDASVSSAISGYLINIIEGMETGALGATALFTLLLTVVALMGAIEGAFNDILEVRQERSWVQRFLNYWLLITLTPFVAVVSTAKSTEFLTQFEQYLPESLLGGHSGFFRFLTAYAVEIFGFALLYLVLPARRVSIRSALLGGAVAAFGFESLQFINSYATAKFIKEASLVQLYGSVPLVIVVLFVWMRLVSLVLLSGMVCTAAFNRIIDVKRGVSDRRRAPVQTLHATISIFALTLQRFSEGRKGTTLVELNRGTGLNKTETQKILGWLEQIGLLWSHKEGGKIRHSPTQKGVDLRSEPDEFVRLALRLQPHPAPQGEEGVANTLQRTVDRRISQDLKDSFVLPALSLLNPVGDDRVP